MKYQRKVTSVDAIQLKRDISLGQSGNELYSTGRPGDWLVTDGDRQYVVRKEDFERDWEEEAPQPPYTFIFPPPTASPSLPIYPAVPYYPTWGSCTITCITSTSTK